MWYAIAEWMDVDPVKIVDVLPNPVNFQRGTTLLTRQQLFDN
jgi:hypothetical protein